MTSFARNVCIYHVNCLDGIVSAWVAWKYFNGNVELIPAQYGDKVPKGLERANVYVVDFSYPLEQMIELASSCNLVVLDHHDTAERACKNLIPSLVQFTGYTTHVCFDMKKSGAGLAWDYFFPGVEAPLGVKLAQDRDLWLFEHELTKLWCAVAFSYPLTVESIDELMATSPDDIKSVGEALLRKQGLDVAKIAKTYRVIDIDGHKLALVNANAMHTSDIGEFLKGIYGAVVIYADGKHGRYFSLRSEGFTTNVLSERFGGGGHVKASAFFIPYDNKRFPKSHVKLRSKGFYWNKVLNLFGRGRREPEWPVMQDTSKSCYRNQSGVKS